VLVTLSNPESLNEYTSTGSLIRNISLFSGYSRYGVKLSNDQFVVIEHLTVRLIDSKGVTIQSYGRYYGSDVGQLKNPTHLAVDGNDNVLVADAGNDRVVLLNSSLAFICYITIPGYELNSPSALHFDKQTNRLYVGDGGFNYNNGRVFVLQYDIDIPVKTGNVIL